MSVLLLKIRKCCLWEFDKMAIATKDDIHSLVRNILSSLSLSPSNHVQNCHNYLRLCDVYRLLLGYTYTLTLCMRRASTAIPTCIHSVTTSERMLINLLYSKLCRALFRVKRYVTPRWKRGGDVSGCFPLRECRMLNSWCVFPLIRQSCSAPWSVLVSCVSLSVRDTVMRLCQ